MKKMLMFLAVAVIAGISQAASIKWTASNIYAGNATDKIAGGAAYLFVADGSLSSADVKTYLGGDAALADKSSYLSSKSLANTTTTSTGTISYTGDVTLADGNYDFFMVVFDSNPITDSSKFFVTDPKTGIAITSVGTASVSIGSQKAFSQDASNFATVSGGGGDVPEPTSGLLLLIGGAMMALRRKQK